MARTLVANRQPIRTFAKSLKLVSGSSQRAKLADGASGFVLGTNNLVFGGWFFIQDTVAIQMLMAKYSGSSYANNNGGLGFELLFRGDQAGKALNLRINNGDGTGVTVISSVGYYPINNGQWNHIVCVLDRTNGKGRIFVNNKEVSVSGGSDISGQAGTITNTGDFYIGRQSGTGTGSHYNGYLSDLFFYNFAGDTLPADLDAFVSSLYYGSFPNSNRLVARWTFDNTDDDAIGNNDLTLEGSPDYAEFIPFSQRATATARQSLKQNYQIHEGTVLEDFDTIGDWAVTGTGATIADETEITKLGGHALKITSVNNVSAYAYKTVSLDLTNMDRFSMWVYIDDVSKYSTSTTALLYMRTSSGNEYIASINANLKTNYPQIVNGWNFLVFRKTDFTSSGSPDWANITQIRLRCLSKADETASIIVDDLRYGYYSRPKVIITFDDGNASDYLKAFAYMEPLELKGVLFVSGENVGLLNQITLVQMQEMYAAGWDMGNHSYSHVDLTTLTSAEVVEELQNDIDYLTDNGMPRAARFLAVPFSNYNNETLEAYATAGLIAARTGMNRLQNNTVADPYQLSRREIVETTSLETAQGYIDEVIVKGGIYIFNFHDIQETPDPESTDWGTADFQAWIDYLALKQQQNYLDVVTISEWYNGLTNSRKLVS